MTTRLKAWAAGHAHAVSILSREAARTSRQWQTYAARAAFSGVLFGLLLAVLWAIPRLPIDPATLGWLGWGLFVLFTVTQQLLIFAFAPFLSAQAIIEEMDEQTLDVLALTHLRPAQILVGKVFSRMIVLALVSFGALPVVSMVATLGGVSVLEVLATTAHHLASITLLSFLGGFYALFTRNGLLATVGAASTAGALFVVPAAVYGVAVMDPIDGVHLSPLLGSSAIDAWAFLPVLAQIPVVLLVIRLSTASFDLHLARASAFRRFGGAAWGASQWMREAAVVAVASLGVVPAAFVCWAVAVAGPGGWLRSALHFGAQGYVWVWMVAATTVTAWPILRLSADVIDGVDRMVTRARRPAERGGAPGVWANPVAWHESRPHRWTRVAGPLLYVAALALFLLLQSMVFFVPGVLVLTGLLGTASAVGATVWLVIRSVETDRREGTLDVLLTTPLSGSAILGGKLAGAVAAGLPLMILGGPLYVLGLWYLDLLIPEARTWFLPVHGLAVWAWTFPAALALVVLALGLALRTNNLRTAFAVTLLAAATWLFGAGIAARLFADVAWVALPMRLLAPPTAGSASILEYLASTVLLLAASAAGFAGLAWRLRALLGPLAALLVALPVWAAEPTLQVRAVGDGLARHGEWVPIRVDVSNPGPATTGTLTWLPRGDIGYERTVELPEGARKSVSLLVRPGSALGTPFVSLTTARGDAVKVQVALQGLGAHDVGIAVLGDDPLGLNGIAEATPRGVPGTRPRVPAEDPRAVRVGLVAPADAPVHASGWVGFDQVVWYRADPTRLDARALDALGHWVADGGHLVVVVSDTAPAVRGSPMAAWLPATLGPLADRPGIDALLVALGAPPAGPVPVAVPSATARTDAWIRAGDADGPLWIAGRHGLGTVTLLLADPRVAPLSGVPRVALWRAIANLPAAGELAAPPELAQALRADPPPLHCALLARTDWQEPVDTWSQPIRGFLSDIPGLAPVPLSWLVSFALLYLALIGPIDWWILRRLRREPFTWVTYPIVIAVFSAIALLGTSWSKGSQAIVRRLELIDALPGTDLWRGTTFLGVFSTRKTQVTLTGGFDDAVIVPLENPGFARDPVVRVGDGPGQLSWSAETWTLAYARTSWVAPAPGEVSARVQADGTVALTNGLPHPIGPVWLQRAGQRVAIVAHVDPGETRALAGSDTPLPGGLEAIADQLEETLDLGHGHLEGRETWATVLAVLPGPIEAVGLTGLVPVEQGQTVLRIPIFARGVRAASLSTDVRVLAGELRPEVVRGKVGELASGCFESWSPLEDRVIVTTLTVTDGQISAPDTDEPLASCVSRALDGQWVPTASEEVRVELTLGWTSRRPGSPP